MYTFLVFPKTRWVGFKACVRYFLSNFCLSTNDSPSKKYEKIFHLKSSFCTRNIQVFVFLSSPLFLPASHCFRGWWKINLKVCDVINYLNKNVIAHFVWYLKKEKWYDTETLLVDRLLNKEHFYWKIMQKMCTKAIARPLFNFGK